MAFSSVLTNLALLVNQFEIGNAIKQIGWHTYIVVADWNVVQATFIYFFAVETTSRTLEELTEIFNGPNPGKRSTQKQKVLVSETTNQVIAVRQEVVA